MQARLRMCTLLVQALCAKPNYSVVRKAFACSPRMARASSDHAALWLKNAYREAYSRGG
jgi:hypothetical protein